MPLPPVPDAGASYRVYGNSGSGGPIDYSTVVATLAPGVTTWASPALTAGSHWKWGVRAFYSGSGLEEKNVDAAASLNLNGSFADVTNLPTVPTHLTATATAGGGVRVEWSWAGNRRKPTAATAFNVYVGTPTPNYATPAAVVPYFPGMPVYRAQLAGLTGGVAYQVAVRSVNATGIEQNTVVVAVTADTTAPANVDSLAASASL